MDHKHSKHKKESPDLEQIEANRNQVKSQGIKKEPGATYVRICPSCQKPNSLASGFCTGCTFPLVEWDEQKLPNLFLNLVKGEDIGCNVRLRNQNLVVFDDKFPVSDVHLDVIPTREIIDITSLTKEDIPLLKGLFKAALDELSKMKLSQFSGKNIEDHVVAGFNFPVSIPHLHLHVVLPPFKHEKVFQYPRWHALEKIISDLEKYNTVKTYDRHPNQAEWEPYFNKAIKDHKTFSLSAPKRSASRRHGIQHEFEKWKKRSKDTAIELTEVNRQEHQISFNLASQSYTLKYPSSKDPESTFFLDGMYGNWETDLNEYIFTENPTKIGQVLDKIIELSRPALGQSSEFFFGDGSDSLDEDQRNARDFGVGADWFKYPPNSWFCKKVIQETKVARSLLGEDCVKTTGLGLCSLYIDITESLNESIAKALELYIEPCTVEFDFEPFWLLSEKDRVPMPVFKIRQFTNNEGNSFGTGFHLKEIVHRYLEDNFKWSTKPLISLGSYNSDKGINPTKPLSHKAPLRQAAKPQEVHVDPIMVEKLQQLGFNKQSVETALAQSNNHYEKAVDKLINMGEKAIQKGPIVTEFRSNPRYEEEILEMGFSRDQARKALKKTNNNLEDAISFLLSEGEMTGEQEFEMPIKEEQENILRRSDGSMDTTPQLSRGDANLFVGIISYVKMRLKHYMRFCMICHKRHACQNDKPVVCCNPLCIFRYAEMMPAKQKEKLKEVDRITICPFVDCDNIARTDTAELLAAFGNTVAMEEGNNQEQMLAMQRHRYLPNEDVMKFINQGVKQSGQTIAKIENVLKPELVAAYEAAWEGMKKKRGSDLSRPSIAYHGTAEANINSILERGLLVPGKGHGKDVGHATDSGWWGGGIYLAPDPGLSISYCRGGKKLLICSVLMGKRFTVTQRMDGADCQAGYDSHVACNGAEWVVFEPSQVLPCYLVSFKQ